MYIQPTTRPVIANLFDAVGNSLVKVGDTVAVRFHRHWGLTIVAEVDAKHRRVRALKDTWYGWSKQDGGQWQQANPEQRYNMLEDGLVGFYWYNQYGMVLSEATWKPLRRERWDSGELCLLTDEVRVAMERCAAWKYADDLLGDLHNLSATDDIAEIHFLSEQMEALIQHVIRRREGGQLQGAYTYLRSGRYQRPQVITTL
jgi:hypothetical protein